VLYLINQAQKFSQNSKKQSFLSYFCAKNKNINKNNVFPVVLLDFDLSFSSNWDSFIFRNFFKKSVSKVAKLAINKEL